MHCFIEPQAADQQRDHEGQGTLPYDSRSNAYEREQQSDELTHGARTPGAPSDYARGTAPQDRANRNYECGLHVREDTRLVIACQEAFRNCCLDALNRELGIEAMRSCLQERAQQTMQEPAH